MLRKRLLSFKYAFKGIKELIKTQPNAKIHLFITSLVIISGLFFEVTTTEWCLLIGAISLVFSAEGFNTAFEYLTDLVSPGYNELAGKVKDLAAGAVLIAAIGAATIGLLIFIPKLWYWIQSFGATQ